MFESMSRRGMLATMMVPLIAGCKGAFAPVFQSRKPSISQLNANGEEIYAILVTSDPHNRNALLNRCIQVGDLIRGYPNLDTFVLGDNANDAGTVEQFQYTHRTWGDIYPRIYPSLGNHDCQADPTATPYYDYYNGVGQNFGKAGQRGKGFYTRDYGNWHIVVLNSERRTAEQQAWLDADLAANAHKHIIGMWHKPMFASPSSKIIPLPTQIGPFWRSLEKVGAEVIFSGHIHRYERFAKLMSTGSPSSTGIRQFLIGLGGAGSLMPPDLGIHPYSEVHFWDNWGLMKVDLHPNSYSWQCVDIDGKIRDQGVETCRKTISEPPPPPPDECTAVSS